MSEKQKDPSDKPSVTQEMIHFSDGRAGLYYRTPGETFDWSMHKHTSDLENQGGPGVALVATTEGRFAIGSGAIIKLTETDPDTQEQRMIPAGQRPIALIRDLNADGLTPVTLGSEWEVLKNEGEVKEILVDYKSGSAEGFPDAHQVPGDNPFDRAKELLRSYAETRSQS